MSARFTRTLSGSFEQRWWSRTRFRRAASACTTICSRPRPACCSVSGCTVRDRAFARSAILEGRPSLSKALDQEHSPQVGYDFGYGPGWVFTSREAARLGKALVSEAAAAEGAIPEYGRDEFRRYAEFFVLAAQSQKSVLTIIS